MSATEAHPLDVCRWPYPVLQSWPEFSNAYYANNAKISWLCRPQGKLTKIPNCLCGTSHDLQAKCLKVTGLLEGSFPLKYLEVPITANKLKKMECRGLVEKITARVKIWAIRSLSFVGRAVLINNVLFGMFTYWASIFILPTQVLDSLTRICRNYLWGAQQNLKEFSMYLGNKSASTKLKVDWG